MGIFGEKERPVKLPDWYGKGQLPKANVGDGEAYIGDESSNVSVAKINAGMQAEEQERLRKTVRQQSQQDQVVDLTPVRVEDIPAVIAQLSRKRPTSK